MPGLIEPEMRNYLASGHTSATNFYLRIAPGKVVFPYGTIIKVSPGKGYTHSDNGANSLFQTRMQCSCFGTTYQQAKLLASEVIEDMEAWAGVETDVDAVFLEGEVDLGEDLDISHVAVDFIVFHRFN